jgi:hypothetical protein
VIRHERRASGTKASRSVTLACIAVASAAALLGACGGTTALRDLTAANLAQVKIGDTTAEVQAKLGPAENVERRDRFGREVWTYDYTDRSQVRAYRVAYLYFDPATGRLKSIDTSVNWDLYPDAYGR